MSTLRGVGAISPSRVSVELLWVPPQRYHCCGTWSPCRVGGRSHLLGFDVAWRCCSCRTEAQTLREGSREKRGQERLLTHGSLAETRLGTPAVKPGEDKASFCKVIPTGAWKPGLWLPRVLRARLQNAPPLAFSHCQPSQLGLGGDWCGLGAGTVTMEVSTRQAPGQALSTWHRWFPWQP